MNVWSSGKYENMFEDEDATTEPIINKISNLAI